MNYSKRNSAFTIYSRPVTKHAKQRFKERTDVAEKDYLEVSQNAFKYGHKIRKFTGELYEYLKTKSIDGYSYTVRVYEDKIFIFDTVLKRLLTVYPIPEEFLPIENFFVDQNSARPCIIVIDRNKYLCEGGNITDDIALALEFKTEQRCNNYIKNDYVLKLLQRQGHIIEVLPL